MAKATCNSADGYWLQLSVESRSQKVVGKDFVGKGSFEFTSKTSPGVTITAKGDPLSDPKRIVEVFRYAIKNILGSLPAVIGPAYASGLIILEWTGQAKIDDQTLLGEMSKMTEANKIGKGNLGGPLFSERRGEGAGTIPPIEEDGLRTDHGNRCQSCGERTAELWRCEWCKKEFCLKHVAPPQDHQCPVFPSIYAKPETKPVRQETTPTRDEISAELTSSEFRTLDYMVAHEIRVGSSDAQDRIQDLSGLELKGFLLEGVYMPERFGSSYKIYVLTEKGRTELEAHGGLRKVTVRCNKCGREQEIQMYLLGVTDQRCIYCQAVQTWLPSVLVKKNETSTERHKLPDCFSCGGEIAESKLYHSRCPWCDKQFCGRHVKAQSNPSDWSSSDGHYCPNSKQLSEEERLALREQQLAEMEKALSGETGGRQTGGVSTLPPSTGTKGGFFDRCPQGGRHAWTGWTIYVAESWNSNVKDMKRSCRKCGKEERRVAS